MKFKHDFSPESDAKVRPYRDLLKTMTTDYMSLILNRNTHQKVARTKTQQLPDSVHGLDTDFRPVKICFHFSLKSKVETIVLLLLMDNSGESHVNKETVVMLSQI